MITHSCKYARTTGSVEFAFDPKCNTYWVRQRWCVSLVQICSGFKESWEVLRFKGSKLARWICQTLLIRFKNPFQFATVHSESLALPLVPPFWWQLIYKQFNTEKTGASHCKKYAREKNIRKYSPASQNGLSRSPNHCACNHWEIGEVRLTSLVCEKFTQCIPPPAAGCYDCRSDRSSAVVVLQVSVSTILAKNFDCFKIINIARRV